MKKTGVTIMTRALVEDFKKATTVPFKELKISDFCSFLFFELGSDSYYIKIMG